MGRATELAQTQRRALAKLRRLPALRGFYLAGGSGVAFHFPVAGLEDLAAMKLAAIATRGIRRDFWDLLQILTRSAITLDRALDAYLTRFGVKKSDLYHVLRALTYFDDAEKDPMPRGLTERRWHAIKKYFAERAPKSLRRRTR